MLKGANLKLDISPVQYNTRLSYKHIPQRREREESKCKLKPHPLGQPLAHVECPPPRLTHGGRLK